MLPSIYLFFSALREGWTFLFQSCTINPNQSVQVSVCGVAPADQFQFAERKIFHGKDVGFGGEALRRERTGPGPGLQPGRRGVSGGPAVCGHLGPGPFGEPGRPGRLPQGMGKMGHGHPAHEPGTIQAGGTAGKRPAVPGGGEPDEAGGPGQAGHCHRRRPGRRAGCPLDRPEGGLEKAHAADVDLFSDRQRHKRGLPESAPRR